jgi:hypothetical protein
MDAHGAVVDLDVEDRRIQPHAAAHDAFDDVRANVGVGFAMVTFCKVEGAARLREAIAGAVPEPHGQRVKEDVSTYLRVGGTSEGLQRILEQSVRAAGKTFGLPNVEVGTPARDIAEHLLAARAV